MLRTILNSRHACSKMQRSERECPLAAPASTDGFDSRLGGHSPIDGQQTAKRTGYIHDLVHQLAFVGRSKIDTRKMQH